MKTDETWREKASAESTSGGEAAPSSLSRRDWVAALGALAGLAAAGCAVDADGAPVAANGLPAEPEDVARVLGAVMGDRRATSTTAPSRTIRTRSRSRPTRAPT
jgi:hypothetical protein